MECALSFSFDDPVTGQAVTIERGARLRADHVAVKVGGAYWVPDGTPDDAKPALVDFVQVPGTTSGRTFTGPTRVKMISDGRHEGKDYTRGRTYTVPGHIAGLLVNQGCAALVD